MPSDNKLLSKYEKLSEGVNYNTATGNTAGAATLSDRLAKLQGKIDTRGLDTSGLDINTFAQPEDFNPNDARYGMNALAGDKKKQLQRSGVDDVAAAMHRWRTKQSLMGEAAAVRGYQDRYMPSIDAAQQKADEAVQQDAISATQEAALRSRIAAMVKGSESSRMQRMSASLGMANAANSPAAAALANQSAQEADRTLVSSLRDTSLNVAQFNQEQRRADIDMASRIAAMRLAIKTGDSKSLSAMNSELSSVLDALYSRERTMDLQWAAANAAGQQPGDTGQRIGSLIGGAAGLALGGPAGAGIGMQAGGTLGGMFDG